MTFLSSNSRYLTGLSYDILLSDRYEMPKVKGKTVLHVHEYLFNRYRIMNSCIITALGNHVQ